MKRSAFLRGAAALALAPFLPVRPDQIARAAPTVLPPADFGPWIQAQIDRGYCRLPAGVYPVRTPIAMRSGAAIVGAGMGKTVLTARGDGVIIDVPADVHGSLISNLHLAFEVDGVEKSIVERVVR